MFSKETILHGSNELPVLSKSYQKRFRRSEVSKFLYIRNFQTHQPFLGLTKKSRQLYRSGEMLDKYARSIYVSFRALK